MNYSYSVFQAIKRAKATLSQHTEVVLDIPEIDIALTVTREDFEIAIQTTVSQFTQALDAIFVNASMAPKDVDIVLRTGGSSLIPCIKAVLEEQFPSKVCEHNPFAGVAAGLAIADYYG